MGDETGFVFVYGEWLPWVQAVLAELGYPFEQRGNPTGEPHVLVVSFDGVGTATGPSLTIFGGPEPAVDPDSSVGDLIIEVGGVGYEEDSRELVAASLLELEMRPSTPPPNAAHRLQDAPPARGLYPVRPRPPSPSRQTTRAHPLGSAPQNADSRPEVEGSPPASPRWPQVLTGVSGRKYRCEGQLGRGGTAEVMRYRTEAGEAVAAKALSGHRFALDEAMRSRFARERTALAAISHTHVVRAVDEATIGGEPVLLMECLPGGTLADRISEEGLPRLDHAMNWLRGALQGLAALHAAGIVHRDITPKNLLFRAEDELVVGDLGIARHLDDSTLTGSSEHLGSLVYIAPEQFDDARTVGPAADVYSMGQIAFLIFSGRQPQGNTGSVQRHAPIIPPEIAEVIEKMRSYEAGARPKDGALALAAFDTAVSMWRQRVTPPAPPWRPVLDIGAELYGPLQAPAFLHAQQRKLSLSDALRLQGAIIEASQLTHDWLLRHVGEGGVLTDWPGGQGDSTSSAAVVASPQVHVARGHFDNPIYDYAVVRAGGDALFDSLRGLERFLRDGSVWLLPERVTVEVESETGSGSREILDARPLLDAAGVSRVFSARVV